MGLSHRPHPMGPVRLDRWTAAWLLSLGAHALLLSIPLSIPSATPNAVTAPALEIVLLNARRTKPTDAPALAVEPPGCRAQPAVAQQDVCRKATQNHEAQAIGGDHEACMRGSEVHQRSPISAIWIWRILRAAISARIATRCSDRNRKV